MNAADSYDGTPLFVASSCTNHSLSALGFSAHTLSSKYISSWQCWLSGAAPLALRRGLPWGFWHQDKAGVHKDIAGEQFMPTRQCFLETKSASPWPSV